eukprot:GHVL01014089.1.p1 GENE.GHVL01014089.1~~GHVL01014089.1.p1  ORF type:complete len:791 (-),score=125.03 GHVL01014089.1:2122-4494(-)
MRKIGFASDWYDYRKEVEALKLKEILIIRDHDKIFGNNYAFTTTPEAHQRELKEIENLRKEAIKTVLSLRQAALEQVGAAGERTSIGTTTCDDSDEEFVTPTVTKKRLGWIVRPTKAWEADERTVEDVEFYRMYSIVNRPKINMQLRRSANKLKNSPTLENSIDSLWSLKTTNKHTWIPIDTMDTAIQTTAIKVEEAVQTTNTWHKPKNRITQYLTSDFLTDEGDTHLYRDQEEVARLTKFFLQIFPRVEEALQHNETVNVFDEEVDKLMLIGSASQSNASSVITEVGNLTELTFGQKIVSHVEWFVAPEKSVVQSTSVEKNRLVVASYTDNLTLSERLDVLKKGGSALLAFWSLDVPLQPIALFRCPHEVLTFIFHPTDPHWIIAGTASGQIMLLHARLDNIKSAPGCAAPVGAGSTAVAALRRQKATPTEEEGAETVKEDYLISNIETSHRRGVTAIRWLTPGYTIRLKGEKKGQMVPKEDPTTCDYHFFITAAVDGQLMIWDFNDAQQHTLQHERQQQETGVGSALPNDFVWSPIFTQQLIRQDTGTEMGLVAIHLKEAASTSFIGTTEEGEVLEGNWALLSGHGDSGRPVLAKNFTAWKTFRPPRAFTPSPFFPDIFLLVLDAEFFLWKPDFVDCPIFYGPSAASEANSASFSAVTVYYTSGCWSPTRAGVLFLGRSDGLLDVWDFSDESHKPSFSHVVASTPIVACAFYEQDGETLLACGDDRGCVHVLQLPQILISPPAKEESNIRQLFNDEAACAQYHREKKVKVVFFTNSESMNHLIHLKKL